MIRLLLALSWCLGLARGGEDDPVRVLLSATSNVLTSTRRIPNYTCIETIQRDFYQPAATTFPRACSVILEQRRHPTLDLVLHLASRDRIRLDVALLQRGEIFSWPGAARFEDESTGIGALVRTGPIGTGAFGSFLSLIFDQDVKKFVHRKTIEEDGRRLMEYAFAVPPADSHYRVKVADSWIFSAYSGTFLVDPETSRVVRLVVETAEMPPAAGSCMTTTALDFGMVRIGNGEFLLTKNARQRFVAPDGQETENTTTFADCREYLGESTVTFETAEPLASGPRPKAAPEKPRVVAPGLRFRMALESSIDSATAAAGDEFRARLVGALRDSRQKLVAASGALVRGRILRVQTFYSAPREVMMVLRPDTVQAGDAAIALNAVRDVTASNSRKKVVIELPLAGEERAGIFRFSGAHAVAPAGFRSDWRTVAP